MIITKISKVWRFLSKRHPSLVGLVDTERNGLESYVDAIRHAIRWESWMKTKKKVNLSVGEGLKKMTEQNQSHVYGNE